jgi:hypothetical protein
MATSLRDLFDAVDQQTFPRGPNQIPESRIATQVGAEDAISAITTTARALRLLTPEPATRRSPTLDPERVDLITQLTVAAQAVAQAWPTGHAASASPSGGVPLAELVAAAADITARLAPTLADAQRWAIAVAFAETVRRCARAAQSYPPYRTVPQLRRAESAAAALEQHATALPPTALSSTVLDRAVPLPTPPPVALGIASAPDAIAGLLHHLRTAVAQHRLTLGDAFAAALAARVAAGHASTLATALTRATATPPPWRAAPAAWQAVQHAYAPFDDGTKTTATGPDAAPPASDMSPLDHAPGGSSPVLTWAITLHTALRTATTAQPTAANAITGAAAQDWPPRPDDLAQTVTVLRAVSNGVPELAVLLRISIDDWHTQQTLYAPERRLTSYEHRNHAVTSTTRVVHPELGDLDELRACLRHSENLSLSLSVQLDRTRPELGTNPQPALAILHAQALDPATLAAAARSALRRATADTPPQWHSRRQAPPPPARSSPAR